MSGARNGLSVTSMGQAWPASAGPMPPVGGAEPQSAVAVIGDRMHGRFKLAVGLGLVLGLALAYAGFRFAPVRYAAIGNVHVASSGQEILRETSDTAFVRRYEGMKQTKQQQINSPTVIDRALRDPELAALFPDTQSDLFRSVRDGIVARSDFNSELISVTYEAEDPTVAHTVLNAVLRSFMEIYGNDSGGGFRSERLQRLGDRRLEFKRQRDEVRASMREIITNSLYGSMNLQEVLNVKLLRIEELIQELETINLALAEFPEPTDAGETPVDMPVVVIGDPTLEDLERIDANLGTLWRQRDLLEVRLAQLAKRLSPTHQAYRTAEQDLELLEARIVLLEEAARERWVATGGVIATSSLDDQLGQLSPDQIKLRQHAVAELLDDNRQQVRALNEEQVRLRELESELEDREETLDEVTAKIQLLTIESDAQFSGRVTVTDWGVLPDYPSQDRRKPMALIGFVGGFGLSCGLFFLLGTLDRRAYSVAQLQHGLQDYRCLGVLPYLGSDNVDAELNETAAQCVHQIRNRIEALRDPAPGYMVVVTSPYQGDGKTSLAMALGWSYAAAGHRTLLMDCDFYGHSLTSQMGLNDRMGVREVLRDRRMEDQVVDLSVPNLSVLGVGIDQSFGPEAIRKDDFGAMCGELRSRYDVIIADTGPFIGSVELLPVAAAANNVVFAVRRGRSRGRLDECIDDLGAINVPCLGVVLNCADRSDCNRYISKSTVSMRRQHDTESELVGGAKVVDRNALVRALERRSTSDS